MSPNTIFQGAKLKLERAKHHIANLEATFRAYVDLNPYVLGSKENPETATKKATIRYTMELPSDIALILGDAVHNLRVALDHTVWGCCQSKSRSQKLLNRWSRL